MSDTIFTKIIRGDIPREVIYEDEYVMAIPDKFPSMEGQTLVVTKKQIGYIFDLDTPTYHALMDAAQKVARALDIAFHTVRTAVIIEGFEVPHVHVRLYPCTTETLVLSPRHEATDAELKIVADKIRAVLD